MFITVLTNHYTHDTLVISKHNDMHQEILEKSTDMDKFVEELTLVRKSILHLRILLAEATQKDQAISAYLKKTHNLHI